MVDITGLDGRLLLVFRELLRCHSATLTAQRLDLSQSAVSHALGRLRRIHADPLFLRRPHGLEPTRVAQELGPRVEELIELAAALYASPTPFDPHTSERQFAVAAPEFVTATIGGQLLSRWAEAAPGVSLVTHQLDHATIVERLRRGDLDLAVGRFGRRPPRGITADALYRDEYCVVARRDHPRIRGIVDRETYVSVGHVLAGSPSEADQDEAVPATVRVRAVVPAWLGALTVVSTSDAIATCPRRLATQYAQPLGLQLVDLPGRPMPVEVAVLRRNDQSRVDVDWLEDELRHALAAAEP